MTDVEKLILKNQLVIMDILRTPTMPASAYDKITDQIIATKKYISGNPIPETTCYLVRDYADNRNSETNNYKYTCSVCKGFIGNDLSLSDVDKLGKCPHCNTVIRKDDFKYAFVSSVVYHIDKTTFPER